MTHAYYAARGLDAFRILCKNFAGRTIALPDLICPDVIAVAYEEFPAKDVTFYEVHEDLSCGEPAAPFEVLVLVDYFGMKSLLDWAWPGHSPSFIYDAVWSPQPFRELTARDFWFNSYRKITTALDTSLILTGRPLFTSGPQWFPSAESWRAALLDSDEVWRGKLYATANHLLGKLKIPGFSPQFPGLFPMLIEVGRNDIMGRLREQGIQLPRPWADTYGTTNPLYGQLMFLPLDSRFTQDDIKKRAEAILSACERG